MTRLAPTKVELEIPITADELRAAEDRAFRKLARSVRLPGFRAGKVPRKVYEQTYGVHAIENQAMQDVVPEVYAKAIREHALEPVDRPAFEFLPEAEGQPQRIKALVEVRPEIVLGTYKGVIVEREPAVVSEEDVERALKRLAKDRATLIPIERPVQLGDVLTLDYAGKIDGVPFEGGTAAGQVTELDEDRFIPGFASGIVGMKTGETREVSARFPDQYTQAELAGKDATFTIVLHDVKEYELPAVDDAFAQAISEHQTAADLRADVRKRLEAIAASHERRAVGNAVMDQLLAAHDVPLPETMIEREIESMVEETSSSATRSGVEFAAFLEGSGKTEESLRAEYRPAAEQRVKGTLLIEAVARAEKIVATPADISQELTALAQQYGQPVERIRAALGNNVLSLMDGIIRSKTLEFLIDNATIVEKRS